MSIARAAGNAGNAGNEARGVSTSQVIFFCVGTFFLWAGMYVYVPVLSVYAKSMGASLTVVGLVVSAYGLTQLLTRIPIGFSSDLIGRRKPFIYGGLVAVAAGCFGLLLSPDPWFLVFSRAIIGLGAATWVAYSVFFASFFPLNRSAHAMAIIAGISSGAQLIAGLVGGLLSQSFGVASTFYAGVALAGLGVVAMLPVKETARPNPKPMSLKRLFAIAGTPALLIASTISIVNTFANFSTILSFVPIYARDLGANDADLGVLSFFAGLAMTVATLVGARVAGILGDRGVIFFGLALVAVGTILVPLTTSFWPLVATQVVAGFGRGVCNPTLMSLSIRALPSHERATGMGIYQAVYSIGMFAGPPLSGAVADQLGLSSVFILTTVLCVGAALGGLFARSLKPA